MAKPVEDLVADGLVTVKEAAAFLRLSVAAVYVLMGSEQLPFVKIGRSRRVPRQALIELASRNLVGGRDT